MKSGSTLLVLFLLLLCFFAKAQMPQIYVHTDRSIYSPGDTIWFKAYLMSNGKLDTTIYNLYMDWANSSGEIFNSSVYLSDKGYSFGQMVVPEEYKSSSIFLNAYTGNIHLQPELGFVKELSVIQTGPPTSASTSRSNRLVVIPEGNKLIAGVENKISIRGEDALGRGFKYHVYLLANNKIIDSVKSDQNGLAVFHFIPIKEEYSIRWKDKSNQDNRVSLPKVDEMGVKIQVEELDDEAILTIHSQGVNLNNSILVGYLNQQKIFEQVIDSNILGKNIKIPKEVLHFGMLNLKLNDSNGNQMAFWTGVIRGDSALITPKIELITLNKEAKGKQSFQISLPNNLNGNLSVSVTEITSPPYYPDHIFNGVLGNQGLGNMKVDSSYSTIKSIGQTVVWKDFTSIVDTIKDVADYFLFPKGKIIMTDKKWKEYYSYISKLKAGKKKTKFMFDPESVSVGYRPVKEDTIRYKFVYTSSSLDSLREFSLPQLQFFDTLEFRTSHVHRFTQYGEMEVVYRFKQFEDRKQMKIPERFDQEELLSPLEDFIREYPQMYKDRRKSIQIEAVKISRMKKRPEIRDKEDLLMVSSYFKNSIKDFLPEEDAHALKYSLSVEGFIMNNRELSRFPIKYLDEKEINTPWDAELLSEFLGKDVSNLGLVKVIQEAGGDVLALYQLHGANVNREFGRQIRFSKLMGYSSFVAFENLKYKNGIENTGIDNRSTLAWYPVILLEKESPTFNVEFYDNSFPAGYWITVKGVTTDGRFVDYKQKVEF